MPYLSLVKSLSRLYEEQKHSDEVLLGSVGLTFARGSVVEIAGQTSSGKTSLVLTLLSKLTSTGEVCAVVDSSGGFDPRSSYLSGVNNNNLLWVKCGGDIERSFLAADHLVQAKGFGAIWLNLAGLSQQKLRMVPKTYWYRYRTRIKDTPTLFLVTAEEHITGSASQQSFIFSRERVVWSGNGKFKLLREFHLKMHSQKGSYGPAVPAKIEFDYTDV